MYAKMIMDCAKNVSTLRGCYLKEAKKWRTKSEIFERACVHFYGHILGLTSMSRFATLKQASKQARYNCALFAPFDIETFEIKYYIRDG